MSSPSTSGARSTTSSQFTCNICEIAFENNSLQRTHAKSDWHIYNLKRHLTSLPPISIQVYNDRVASIQETSTTHDLEGASFHQPCTTCVKNFYSPKSYHNHLQSTTHAQAALKLESNGLHNPPQADLETITSQISTSDPFPFCCLFCPHPSSSLDLNMEHMHQTHTFSVPHQDFLFDLGTFIAYLSKLITTFQECLYCGQTRDTTTAIRQHMVDKGHCRLADDAAGSEEFEDFFDFSDMESDEEDSENGEKETNINSPMLIPSDANELQLPSGRTLIHRSKGRYYRQNHVPPKISTQKTIEGRPNRVEAGLNTPDRRAIMSLQRSENANKGMIGVSELEKRAVRALEKKMLNMEVRARNVYQARVDRGGNRQKFFKPDVPGPKNG
ncbi:C2H2 type zinc-finger-domain-containing protein [Leptodontidium sp. MPI-SDFR-AT-0119]|nr:C2H2 type zinc-finger-domain-containing protein [Leptodontidium sp. MPI-SDFR-AT-0119]